jgi:uncharacterized membrane protein
MIGARMLAPRKGFGPAWTRIVLAATAGGATAAVTAVAGAPWAAPSTGWIAGAASYVIWNWAVILRMSPEQTARHATREDPSAAASGVLILAACLASIVAVALLLAEGRSGTGTGDADAALAVGSIAAAWFVTHTVFTLGYARLYYNPPAGGIDFNQDAEPRYADFAYLAFTIGMTYQVSDTNLTAPEIRARALRHALLSFLLGAIVLATTVNLIVGLGTS